ncbi:hypothetical protein [Bacteroides sp. 519]|uniref:hypothetical protein n=1 Tax=Bacteroides sp. 519 TaxID=2302937 RepID=UPI0013CFA29C|nr:hypothetical protein [Bacteroides sp. 519]NDV57162.1 hypothetical protein [Bacteroides sp. 519]
MKTLIILSLFALFVSGCKPKPNSTNQQTTYSCPIVSAEEIAKIAPVIKKWTDFNNIDFTQAKLISVDTICLDCPLDPKDIYPRDFDDGDADRWIDVDYSPNKQRYVDLGLFGGYDVNEDEEFVFLGWDDCQEVSLVDCEKKIKKMVLWLGSSERAEDVFWKSDDIFIVVGHNCGDGFVCLFDITKQTKSYYQIEVDGIEGDEIEVNYINKVYWKEKGIVVVEP